MKTACFVLLPLVLAVAAFAHPHPGGIVVRGDRVLVGDVVRSKLLVIERAGVRELDRFGHVRDLQEGPGGTIYGVSQGRGGLWKLGQDDTPVPVRPDFNGLFAVCADGTLALAPADELDRRPRLHYRGMTPLFDQIEALLCVGDTIYFADDRAVRAMDRDGAIATLAEDLGGRMYGLTAGPDGPIAAVYDTGKVVEVASGRVLATSEPPWKPVDVVLHDGTLYVVELSLRDGDFGGPRVRRIRGGESATLVVITSRRMSAVEFFPPLNASLNALSGILLVVAYRHIRAKRIAQHRRFMLAACATSVLFLVSYVTYHTIRGGVVTKFAGTGGWRALYLAILTSHTILAVVILPLAILSVWNGLKMRVPQHRRVAKWTFPLWMYVSVTGVLVYFFLYHWFPGEA